MKYLVTGGCGFVGSNLAKGVLDRGEELVVFDNLQRRGSENNLVWLKECGDFTYHYGDIRSFNDIERVVKEERPDVVFHLAGQVAMTTSLENPRYDFETNTMGTFNLLEALRAHAPDCQILYSSTNKVYGDLEWIEYGEMETRFVAKGYENGFGESVPLDFKSPYGCSKGAADQYLLDYYKIFGLKSVVFRHSSMFGGRQYAHYDQGWVGWFCQKAHEIQTGVIEDFTIHGTGKQVRDLLHADDVVNLYFMASDNIDRVAGSSFNIGGGMENSFSLLELFAYLEQKLGIEMKYRRLEERQSDQKVFVADYEKINQTIGWKPLISREEGVDKMIDWISEVNQ